MLYVVLVYCLAGAVADDGTCIERTPIAEGFSLPIACLQAGQQAAADRAQQLDVEFQHPDYRLARVRCDRGHRRSA